MAPFHAYAPVVPTYEYRCTVCDTPFEQRRSMSDTSAGHTVRCPQGHDAVRRVFSVFAAAKGAGGSPGPMGGGNAGGGCCGGSCGCG